MGFIVGIDGTAGSGKGTVTKQIASKMNLLNIDTGSMYRCVALAALRANAIDGENIDAEKVISLLDSIEIKITNTPEGDIVFLNGENVTKKIREVDVSRVVSPVSAIPEVRVKLVDLQRKMAEGKNVIMEGRDICTVVFPNADVKIYLDATPEERARRRMRDLSNQNITFQEVLENIKKRDENDKNKKVGALKMAEDSIYIDTTNLSIEEVVAKVQEIIVKKKQQDLDNER